MDELRNLATRYSAIDEEIKEGNKILNNKREQRKILELEIIDVMKSPQFATVKKFQHQSSTFVVDQPEQWHGSWYLSKADLNNDIVTYLNSHEQKDPEGLYEFIIQRESERSIKSEWRITRHVSK
jgi:hypothetical protein